MDEPTRQVGREARDHELAFVKRAVMTVAEQRDVAGLVITSVGATHDVMEIDVAR